MAPVETPATILATLAYGETSRIARLATRDLGVVSVIAKGARRPRSRFGAALQVLSEGTASIIPARHGDLHTLAAFDVQILPTSLGRNLERYASASLLGELMLACASHHDSAEIYAFFRHALNLLDAAPDDGLGTLGLRAIWGLVKRLGVAPSLDRCVHDDRAVPQGTAAAFSADLGGVLCAVCARDVETIRLPAADRADLAALLHGGTDLPLLDARHLAAHRRFVERYVRRHLAEGAAFPALAFWSERPWVRHPA